MFLAFKLSDIVTVPFGYLMDWLYQLTTNYGWALVLFAVLVKIILFPITAKSKKSTMKMSRLTPKMQAIQKKYANDKEKLKSLEKLTTEKVVEQTVDGLVRLRKADYSGIVIIDAPLLFECNMQELAQESWLVT